MARVRVVPKFDADRLVERAMRRMPVQRPATSKQDVSTPIEFLRAVERRFGRIVFDLAADADNEVCARLSHANEVPILSGKRYFDIGDDALSKDWATLKPRGTMWLNPEFGNIAPFVERAATTRFRAGWLPVLVPASIGTRWWDENVHGKAMVQLLRPRIKFVGHTQAFPKDLALACYGHGAVGYVSWRWDREDAL